MTKYNMDREELLDILESNESLIVVGFNDALIGISEGRETVAVYDLDLCITILMDKNGMEEGEAIDFFYIKTLDSYLGDKTPLFISLVKENNKLQDAIKLINKN